MPETPVAVVPNPVVEVTPKPETLITAPVVVAEPVKPAPVAEPIKAVEPAKPTSYELKQASDSALNPDDLVKLKAQALKDGLTTEQAQALLDTSESSIKSYVAREIEKTKQQAPKWVDELKADKQYGGEKFNETIENAKRVIEKYAEPDFKKFLNDSGLGNHPMIVKAFAKIGMSFGEDHWKDGSAIVPKRVVSPAERMYDKTPK